MSVTKATTFAQKPAAKASSIRTFPGLTFPTTSGDAFLPDSAWLLGRTLVRSNRKERAPAPQEEESHPDTEDEEDGSDPSVRIPSWAAYHSCVSPQMKKTRIDSAPLIAAPAHEWQTLLTILMQAQHITTKMVGVGHKTVVSLDLGLYKPTKQLQMSRSDLDHLLLRPGELHIVMAQLRCIGAYVEGSGIDASWVESGVYGSVTVKKIAEGKHVKQGVEAHLLTLQTLRTLIVRILVVNPKSTQCHAPGPGDS